METPFETRAGVRRLPGMVSTSREVPAGLGGLGGMIGKSLPMQELFRRLLRASRDESPVLIHGETGAGKTLAAITLHGLRASGAPCRVLSGAAFERWLQEADSLSGTLVLDEVGDLAPVGQLELGRLLAAGSRWRTGLRFVFLTSRDLRRDAERGKFPRDLLALLQRGAVLGAPSLRERREDLPGLISHFLQQFHRSHGKSVRLGAEAGRLIQGHAWPGNVRELRNEIERAVLLTADGEEVQPHALSPDLGAEAALLDISSSLKQSSKEMERRLVSKVLARNGWNVSATARELGISRVGLSKKLRILEIRRPSSGLPEPGRRMRMNRELPARPAYREL
jgi:DNA-binding NtrC family response regulator